MGNEFFELCHESLAVLLKERNLSQAELAHRLDMSKKTVQRWINRTTRRISAETLEKLAEVLNAPAERLTRSGEKIQIRPFHAGLKELTTEDYLVRVRISGEWESYLKILLSFPIDETPSQQQALVYKNVGIANIYLGKLRAAKNALQKSISLAQTLQDEEIQILSHSWLALRDELYGSPSDAQSNIEKAESLLNSDSRPMVKAVFYFLKGRVLYHGENNADAHKYMRMAISQTYMAPEGSLRITAIYYMHLSWAQLRDRNYAKAKSSLRRVRFYAEKTGWVRGQAIAHLTSAVLDSQVNPDCPEILRSLKRGRGLRRSAKEIPLETQLEQAEFVLSILNQDFEKAKIWVQKRITASQSSPLLTANAIMDALFLNRLCPGIFTIRPSIIEKAEKLFAANNLIQSTRNLNYLLGTEKISREDFIKKYIF